MKYTILAAIALIGLACSSQSQTIKSLGYDTTNGKVIYGGTNALTFTNPLQFDSGVRAATRTNLDLGATWLTNTSVTNFRTAIGLGATWLTNTNVTNFRTAIGLGTTNSPVFSALTLGAGDEIQINGSGIYSVAFGGQLEFETRTLEQAGFNVFAWATNSFAVTPAATFATNVSIAGSLTVGSFTTTTPSTWALDATQTAAATNGRLTLPSNANVIRLTNNNAISSVTNGVLGAFYYLVNPATDAVTISNVGGITIDGATNLTLAPNESATLVALGPTNISVANRGGLETTNNVEFRRLRMIAANAVDDGDDSTLWLDTSGTNQAASLRLSGTGGGAEKYNAYLQGGSAGLTVSAVNGFRVLDGGTAGTGSVMFGINSSGNATLNGVNNTAPSQTADSASSLMTRGLSDTRYLPSFGEYMDGTFYRQTMADWMPTRVTNGGSATFDATGSRWALTSATNVGNLVGVRIGRMEGINNSGSSGGNNMFTSGFTAFVFAAMWSRSNSVLRFVVGHSTGDPIGQYPTNRAVGIEFSGDLDLSARLIAHNGTTATNGPLVSGLKNTPYAVYALYAVRYYTNGTVELYRSDNRGAFTNIAAATITGGPTNNAAGGTVGAVDIAFDSGTNASPSGAVSRVHWWGYQYHD